MTPAPKLENKPFEQIEPIHTLTVRHCPKCGSLRVHRSRRRGILEGILFSMGAAVCRCHDCRTRRAWLGPVTLPLAKGITDGPELSGLAMFAAAFVACIVLLWWMITNFTGLSG